ncbi:MAG: imelysin family protein [Polaribacter sp.]
MLTYWADYMIIPAYTNFSRKATKLKTATTLFTTTPNQTNLKKLRTKWQEAYVLWQRVALFQVGKAMELSLLYYMNTYPTEVKGIKENITKGGYDLTSINLSGQQGFPAIDYLINGLGADDTAILKFYTDANASKYKNYLDALADRIASLSNQILADWKGEYREKFINNDGSSATSSVDNMVNSYIVTFYEVELRNKKIRIPLGKGTMINTPLPTYVEAYYKKNISKLLLTTALTTAQDFFNGKSFDGKTTETSLKEYLIFLKRSDLVERINNQFEGINKTVALLNDNFVTQIATDRSKMTQTLNELQKLVVSLKTDMAKSAMSIKIVSGQDGDND